MWHPTPTQPPSFFSFLKTLVVVVDGMGWGWGGGVGEGVGWGGVGWGAEPRARCPLQPQPEAAADAPGQQRCAAAIASNARQRASPANDDSAPRCGRRCADAPLCEGRP